MNPRSRTPEASLDTSFEVLPPLPAPAPSRAVVDRVTARVLEEARRLRASNRFGRAGRFPVHVLSWAAAVVLAAGLAWRGGTPVVSSDLSAAESLSDWTAAVDQSARAVALISDDDWSAEPATLDDARRGLRDFIECVDESLGEDAS